MDKCMIWAGEEGEACCHCWWEAVTKLGNRWRTTAAATHLRALKAWAGRSVLAMNRRLIRSVIVYGWRQ